MTDIKTLVTDLLSTHGDGKPFFDALGDACLDDDLLIQLEEVFNAGEGMYPYIVTTGKYGRFMSNIRQRRAGMLLIHAPGGLRDGVPMDDLSYMHDELKDKPFILIDDSIYSGRTRNFIEDELLKHGSHIKKVYVIYDGTKDPRSEHIVSLFRFHPDEGECDDPGEPIKTVIDENMNEGTTVDPDALRSHFETVNTDK